MENDNYTNQTKIKFLNGIWVSINLIFLFLITIFPLGQKARKEAFYFYLQIFGVVLGSLWALCLKIYFDLSKK